MTPVRVQRSRKAGSKLPPNTVCVTRGRGMKWGNPFPAEPSIEKSLADFRSYAENKSYYERDWLEPLRGKNLACFCPIDQPCHADVLLELANR